MDQLKQVPGFRRWKKDRKHFIRILLVMSLSFFLMEFSFLLSDSLETTLDQRRKDAYGEWQFALLNLDPSLGETHTLDQNPFIEHFGYIWSQGMLANDGLDGDYGVGGSIAPLLTLLNTLVCLIVRSDEKAERRLRLVDELSRYQRKGNGK